MEKGTWVRFARFSVTRVASRRVFPKIRWVVRLDTSVAPGQAATERPPDCRTDCTHLPVSREQRRGVRQRRVFGVDKEDLLTVVRAAHQTTR